MADLHVGQTVGIKVTFRDYSSDGEQGPTSVSDPNSVVVQIYDDNASPTLLGAFPVTRISEGVYSYDWTPISAGMYHLLFVGAYTDGNVTVRHDFSVDVPEVPIYELGSDYEAYFFGPLDYVYLDPEQFLDIYPDADFDRVIELLMRVGREAAAIMKRTPFDYRTYEYIYAATICSLSRVYDDMMDGITAMTLGDFNYQARGSSKKVPTRAFAGTWCEYAEALRFELLRINANPTTYVRGARWNNPIPNRAIKSSDLFGRTSVKLFTRDLVMLKEPPDVIDNITDDSTSTYNDYGYLL